MDSERYNFVNKNIWKVLGSTLEWDNYQFGGNWYSFIESKDLGIVCVDVFADVYSITDEKKWLLTKIKYGF